MTFFFESPLLFACGLLVVAFVLFWQTFLPATSETTLRPAVYWGAVAIVVCCLAEFAVWLWKQSPGLSLVRYAAAISLLTPNVSMLGAKKPQHGMWQWIVAALWCMAILPGLQIALLRPSSVILPHAIWGTFLILVWGVGWGNYLPTRHVLPGLLIGAGQGVALSPYIDFLPATWRSPPPGLSFFLIATGLILLGWQIRPTAKQTSPFTDSLSLWDDFKHLYGALWSLRVAERVTELCARDDAKHVSLQWQGFVDHEGKKLSIERIPQQALGHLKSILNRFASDDWIKTRSD